MKRTASIGLLLAGGLAWAFPSQALATDWVSVPLLEGESLDELIVRIHPCPIASTDIELQKIIQQNREVLKADGKFALLGPSATVTRIFMEQGTQCRPPGQEPAPEPVASGGACIAEDPPDPHRNRLRLAAGTAFTSVSSNDFQTDQLALGSRPELASEVEFQHRAGERLLLGVRAEMGSVGYTLPGGIAYPESSFTVLEADLDVGARIDGRTEVALELGARQLDQVNYVNSSQATLGLLWAPRIGARAEHEFYELHSFSLGLSAETAMFLPAEGTSLTSLELGAGLFVRRTINDRLSAEISGSGAFQRLGFSGGAEAVTIYSARFGLSYRF